MGNDFFQTRAYVDYLREHCRPGAREDNGRVPGTDFIELMLNAMCFAKGATVLEIGCGIGRIMQLMEGVWGVTAHGCDVSEPAIAEAKRLLPGAANRLFVSPAEHVLSRDRFDHIIFWGVFEMTEQRLALVEVSRLLKLGGTAMLCAVKSTRYHANDVDSRAAHRAYIEKQFPITYSDLVRFEALLDYLGLAVAKRLVFDRKGDVAKHAYRVEPGTQRPPERCCDIYYIIEKLSRTPLDELIQVTPAELEQPGGSA